MSDWFAVENLEEVPSPALLVYPERIRENIRRMIEIAGGASRLRPHIKTHKMAEVVRMQLKEGISKYKCATIAEAEMAAGAGAKDILLAYPIIGPNMARLLALVQAFPMTAFSCVADDESAIQSLSNVFADSERKLEVLLDLDCGPHRTGIPPGENAKRLYGRIATAPGLRPGGLHVYDGHIHESDLAKRTELCAASFSPIDLFCRELVSAGLAVPRVVAGGTPTFPIHARNSSFECSPGTCVLWDFGYATNFSDLNFLIAALVLTRVVSKPGANLLCVDLGHKGIAAENPPPRVEFLNLRGAKPISHSEEHLVIEVTEPGRYSVGDCLFGAPRHICPTVALYSEATVVSHGIAAEHWRIARARRLTI